MPRLQEARLLAATGWRMVREDPMWLAVQAARRFAPAKRLALAPRRQSHGLLAALGAYIADQPEQAAALLRARGVKGTRPGDALAARVAVQVGAPDAIDPVALARPEVAAALAVERGDLTGALQSLARTPGHAQRKLLAERRMLQPGFRLPVPDVAWRRPGSDVRVLHILTNSLPHTRSGYTGRTHHLLKALQSAGVSVDAVTRIGYPTTVGLLGAADVDVVDCVSYRRLLVPKLAGAPDARLEQQVAALIPVARRFDASILHTTTDYTNALVTQAVADALRLPWVYEMRGQLELSWVAARAEAYRTEAADSERVRLLRAKEAELATAADAVVVLSGVQRDDMVARGLDPDRIVIVPNAIDPGLLKRNTSPADARRRLGLPTDAVWVGTVSSLVGYEGLDDLLRAVALLRGEGLDVRALMVGDGVSRPSLMALAHELGLGENALFPGRVPAAEAAGWFEALDIFAVPRKDTPVTKVVTPLKPVEAMALARPVVASDLPALREVAADGAAGELFTAGDPASLAEALSRLLDPDVRAARGRAGRVAVHERTWSAGASTLLRVYERLRG